VKMVGIEATLATPERAESMDLDLEEWRRGFCQVFGCFED